jgi:hypothetical protein
MPTEEIYVVKILCGCKLQPLPYLSSVLLSILPPNYPLASLTCGKLLKSLPSNICIAIFLVLNITLTCSMLAQHNICTWYNMPCSQQDYRSIHRYFIGSITLLNIPAFPTLLL